MRSNVLHRLFLGLLLAGAPLALAGAEFHVSAAVGDDRAPGSFGQPVATLQRARDLVREARRTQPAEPVTVWIAGGDYLQGIPLVLGPEDSGTATAPVVWRAKLGEQPRLLGARVLKASDFQAVTDPATLARLAPEAAGKIRMVDAGALGLKRLGPYPEVFTDTGGILSLFTQDRRLPIARFPDRGFMTIRKILFNAGGPTTRKWEGADWHLLEDHPTGGIFEFRDEVAAKHATWAGQLDRGVWVKGYWRIPWQNEAIRIRAIDTEKQVLTLSRPIPGGIGNKYLRPEGNGRESYWVMNLLEEVNRPGEWCLDFKDRKIYLYPPASLEQTEILVADTPEPVITLRDATHLTLRGLLVTINAGPGIQISGGEHNLIAGCTVRLVDDYGVRVEGGKNHVVRSNELTQLGSGGVFLAGGDDKATPRVPAGHLVTNNHLHHFSELQRVYTPGVNIGFTGGGNGGNHTCVGMTVTHNLIHDTPHAGVLLGSYDNVIEYNEIFRFAMVSNDMGGIYSYDRQHQFGNHVLRFNYIHSSADGDAIYFDHDHPNMTVFGNVIHLKSKGKRGTSFLYKIGDQAQFPQTIDCRNNIAIESNFGFEFVSAQPTAAKIEANVVVRVPTPFTWSDVHAGKKRKIAPYASGPQTVYAADPGFVDLAGGDLRLRPDSQVFKDLPGFQAIPFEKIGLFVDEYRTALPAPELIDRAGRHVQHETLEGYQILDRK
jgi:hypothetical protein